MEFQNFIESFPIAKNIQIFLLFFPVNVCTMYNVHSQFHLMFRNSEYYLYANVCFDLHSSVHPSIQPIGYLSPTAV